MTNFEVNCMSAEDRQRYFEWLCSMDEEDLRELWEKSEACARWRETQERLERARDTDLVPLIHAKWEFGELDAMGVSVNCSHCGWGVENADPVLWLDYPGHQFCGACGAKMDLDSDITEEVEKGN